MELCSEESPTLQSARRMAARISFTAPSLLPPIEKWIIVARKANGESKLFESWADYQAEFSAFHAVENESLPELAAFPTMTQAVAHLKYCSLTLSSLTKDPEHKVNSGKSSPSDSFGLSAQEKAKISCLAKRVVSDGDDGDCNNSYDPPRPPLKARVPNVEDQVSGKRKPHADFPSQSISDIQIPSVPNMDGIGCSKRIKTSPSSLEALAMAASRSHKDFGSSSSARIGVMDPSSPRALALARNGADGAQGVIAPHSVLQSNLGRVPDSSSLSNPSLVQQRNNIAHYHFNRNKLTNNLTIPEVPTNLTIPDVPRFAQNKRTAPDLLNPVLRDNATPSISSLVMSMAGYGSATRPTFDSLELQKAQQRETYLRLLQEKVAYESGAAPFAHSMMNAAVGSYRGVFPPEPTTKAPFPPI